jgi:hypothetical protein
MTTFYRHLFRLIRHSKTLSLVSDETNEINEINTREAGTCHSLLR